MKLGREFVAALGTVACLLWACGGEDGGTDTSDASVSDVGGDVAPDALPKECNETKACTGTGVCRSGVCVVDPPGTNESKITEPVSNASTNQSPVLSCADQAAPTPAGPETVTLYGAVTRFGSGRPTFDIEVAVFDAATWDPSACEDEPTTEKKLDCYQEYGTPLASAVSVEPQKLDPAPSCANKDFNDDCPLGYECTEADGFLTCKLQFGLYQIPGVPTNTPLILRARYAGTEAFIASKWHDVYLFNVYLSADSADADGNYRYDATMVSDAQWILTPNTVFLPEVPEEHGVVGGRIRDCGVAGERESWPMSEVSLGLAREARRVVYFNNLENDSLPLVDRKSTNILGRFAALDIEGGWNVIAGSARVGGQLVSVGSERVYVVPNALSVITFPGLHPVFKQEAAGEFPE
ncbi:MAG: hypothetical protein H6744_16320 [Deltaproteobacteria bacterium]|nr:hypothetical protein [Deltaproteobacteria bacterium]MCB9788249.1 hypothetical protein [Deltaproteobacteria bacterium]